MRAVLGEDGIIQRIRLYVMGRWEERLLAQWITSAMIAVHWGLGLAVLAGGTARFTIPSYTPLIDLSGGHPWIWGLTIMLSAALMMVPFKWPNVLGLWFGMVWMILWTSAFTVAVVQYPSAAATPVPAYAGLAMIDAALLTARVLERAPRGG